MMTGMIAKPSVAPRERLQLWGVLCALLFLLVGCWGDEPATQAPAAAVVAQPETTAPVLQPTYTPTAPSAALAPVGSTSVVTPAIELTAPATLPTTPTLTPTPTATLPPPQQLALARQAYRVGDYAAARTLLTGLLTASGLDPTQANEVHTLLARTYLADDAPAAALPILNTLSLTTVLSQSVVSSAAVSSSMPLTATTALAAVANPAAQADFLRAVALSELGEQGEAIAAYWRFLEVYPWMAEFVQPRIAAAYLALGDRTGAATAYRRAADAATDRVAKARLLEALGSTYAGAGSYAQAVQVYDEILGLAQNPGYRAEIQLLAGQALAGAGDLANAITRWRQATEEAPASGAAYRALVELVNREVPFDLYQRGYIDLQAGAYLPAINAYQAYIDSVDPTDSRVAIAWQEMGQAYRLAENYAAATETLDHVITTYPTCTCVGQAWLDKAATQLALEDVVGARRTYRTFARDYPDHPLAAEALWRSGLQAVRNDEQVEAAKDFLTLADAFPTSERAGLALYLVGVGAYQQGLPAQAVPLFARLQADYPEYNWPAVGYWLGRAYFAAGKEAEARATWNALVERAPDIYYGVLAAYSLRETPLVAGNFLTGMSSVAGPAGTLEGDDGSQAFAEQWLTAWRTVPGDAWSTLPPTVTTDIDLAVGGLLLQLDQRAEGLAALERVYTRNRDNPHALYAMSLTFEQMGAYRLSLVAMTRLLEFSPAKLVENAPIFLQKRSYPQPFAELITAEAQANRINPLLYFSLIRQESLFEEGAYSSAAAQGLAQIIPDTGHWVAQQLGHPEYTNEIIYRPHINLKFGAYYLAWARNYLDGNLVSALVGYNAGPGNAEYWREIAGGDDPLFVELLTVSEPRIYVQSITTGLYHYTRLYGSGG